MKSIKRAAFNREVEFKRARDGRWIADIAALPGVTAYGRTRKEALAAAEALALRVLVDRMARGETAPGKQPLPLAIITLTK